jgi:hypothetical protein
LDFKDGAFELFHQGYGFGSEAEMNYSWQQDLAFMLFDSII